MSKRATIRKRCAECRTWFTPPARLAKQQVVCGASCRLRRRRKQARTRRAARPVHFREEERERKRRSRQEQRRKLVEQESAGVGAHERAAVGRSHGPGEAPNRAESGREFAYFWDELSEVSRAGWEREVRKVAREVWKKLRHTSSPCGRVSRAG